MQMVVRRPGAGPASPAIPIGPDWVILWPVCPSATGGRPDCDRGRRRRLRSRHRTGCLRAAGSWNENQE